MEETVSVLNDIRWMILALVSVVLWLGKIEWSSLTNKTNIREHNKRIVTIFERLDAHHVNVELLKTKAEGYDIVVGPQAQKEHWIMQTQVLKDIEHLKRDK